MTEALLQFIWRYQLLIPNSLQLIDGTPVHIKHPGQWNTQSGPDFLEATIEYDGLEWHGAIEVHLKSSYWYAHGHHQQASYDNVILHVVWEHDMAVVAANGVALPSLVLREYVAPQVIARYQSGFSSKRFTIPCGSAFGTYPELHWMQYSTRLFVARLEDKTQRILQLLQQTTNDWEAVCFQLLALNFGLNRNGTHFEAVASDIPFAVLRKVRTSIIQLEALLLGQSGLLEQEKGSYSAQLRKEYSFLKRKFGLHPEGTSPEFLRLRPQNFPTLRWAQLARLYHETEQLFQAIVQADHPSDLQWMQTLEVSAYWQKHYNFDIDALSTHPKRGKKLSQSFFNLLCINTFVPLRFAYQKKLGQSAAETAIRWMEQLPAEQNSIVKKFKQLGRSSKDALGSQSMLQLYHAYCQKKRCLECAVGVHIMQA